jgi:hypothetical protein
MLIKFLKVVIRIVFKIHYAISRPNFFFRGQVSGFWFQSFRVSEFQGFRVSEFEP